MFQRQSKVMGAVEALGKSVLFTVLLTMSGASFAQDAIPETPPELRDFRLDPERAQPRPEPVIELPVVTPPAAVPTAERQAERPDTQPQRPPTEAPLAEPETAPVAADPLPETTAQETILPEEVVETPYPGPAVAPPATPLSTWQVALGLGSMALLITGFWAWRRREHGERDSAYTDSAEHEPRPVDTVKVRERVPTPPIPKPAVASELLEIPKLRLDFIPEKATVSFTSLTVKGQLRLINESDKPATAIELRAGLMTASATQNRRIDDFHRSTANIKGEPLGDAKPGEMIAMAIELAVPLADMESFTVGQQKLLVPIVIANLSYHLDADRFPETTRFSCMIGREATPPVAKMGPLRLDLGPRSFASLGQRPVLA